MSKRKTHKQFLDELWDKCKMYREGEFKVLGTYISNAKHIVIKNKYGYLRVRPVEILRKCNCLRIKSAIFKDAYFKEMLIDKSRNYRKRNYKIVSKYITGKEPIYVENKYGVMKSTPADLLSNRNPSIISAVNRKNYVHNILMETNDDYRTGDFEIEKVENNYITLKDKYGCYRPSLNNLRVNASISIRTALDLSENIKNRLTDVHGDKYDYSLIKNIKNTSKGKLKILCKIHGLFKQSYYHHYYSKSGCPKCGTIEGAKKLIDKPTGWSHSGWVKTAKTSKNFDSYKVYVVKFTDKITKEEFYKIGRTFLKIHKRFAHINRFYDKEIIKVFESEDPLEIINKEIELLKSNKSNKYLPKRDFHGKNECFSSVRYD